MAAVKSLDHVTITTPHIAATAAFFTDLLGLEHRPEARPDFGFPGAWLFLDDRAVVHLIHTDVDLGSPSGAFDHIAFTTNDFEELVERVEEMNIDHRIEDQPQTGLLQLFVHEPNGVEIEITCPADPARRG